MFLPIYFTVFFRVRLGFLLYQKTKVFYILLHLVCLDLMYLRKYNFCQTELDLKPKQTNIEKKINKIK